MSAFGPIERIRSLPRSVLLNPIRSGVTQRHEAAYREHRNSWIIEHSIAVEAGDSEIGARALQPVYRPVIQGIGAEVLPPDAKIIDHVGADGLGISEDPVARGHGQECGVERTSCAGKDGLVLPGVPEKETNLVSDILVDPIDGLVVMIVVWIRCLEIRCDAGQIRQRHILERLLSLRREFGRTEDITSHESPGLVWIAERLRIFREVALAHQRSEDRIKRSDLLD